jgi:hypothetical protein
MVINYERKKLKSLPLFAEIGKQIALILVHSLHFTIIEAPFCSGYCRAYRTTVKKLSNKLYKNKNLIIGHPKEFWSSKSCNSKVGVATAPGLDDGGFAF